MAVKKMPNGLFADKLGERYVAKDGYIMCATGQDPKKWAKNSWWFTQYNDSPEKKKKALYWREHAERVWDCQGLSEGLYNDYAGTKVDVRARNNYASWCNPKGTGMIPEDMRVPGAAVFWGDGKDPSSIHHVAYLWKPVDANNPKGDWYIIEAKGVMYGVVRSKLFSRKPNYWGHMTKYFDYNTKATENEPAKEPEKKPEVVDGKYVDVNRGSYYIRAEPDSKSKDIGIAKKGSKLTYLGVTENGWYKVLFDGKEGWISQKCGDIVGNDTPTIEQEKPVEEKKYVHVTNGSYHVRNGASASFKSLGIVKKGTKLPYLDETKNGWFKVLYNDQEAWISGKCGKIGG